MKSIVFYLIIHFGMNFGIILNARINDRIPAPTISPSGPYIEMEYYSSITLNCSSAIPVSWFRFVSNVFLRIFLRIYCLNPIHILDFDPFNINFLSIIL